MNMNTRTFPLLALTAMLALYPVSISYADSTTPPFEQGTSPGTAPKADHTSASESDDAPHTNSSPKLVNKIPPGGQGVAQ